MTKLYKFVPILLLLFIDLTSCSTMKNYERPLPANEDEGIFFITRDGTKIFVYNYLPKENTSATVYILSGITGINHNKEKDIIDILSNNENRVVVIHPRGTGYSEGKRGDIDDFSKFIEDYVETINYDIASEKSNIKVILYGHSMAAAILLSVAEKLTTIHGAVLINPPYTMKNAKGMTPGIGEYIKYACYYLFAPHKPIVNMAGEPSLIKNSEERKEAEERANDPLLVKYFSLYTMIKSRKMMDQLVTKASKANYPLLLIYGTSDSIVEKSGCDEIFNAWKNQNKKYELIENGTHGKLTVFKAAKTITDWISNL